MQHLYSKLIFLGSSSLFLFFSIDFDEKNAYSFYIELKHEESKMQKIALFLLSLCGAVYAASVPSTSTVQAPETEALASGLDTDEDIELEEEAGELDD